jgi:hypothetical protein
LDQVRYFLICPTKNNHFQICCYHNQISCVLCSLKKKYVVYQLVYVQYMVVSFISWGGGWWKSMMSAILTPQPSHPHPRVDWRWRTLAADRLTHLITTNIKVESIFKWRSISLWNKINSFENKSFVKKLVNSMWNNTKWNLLLLNEILVIVIIIIFFSRYQFN